ncbi:hypothetical protein BJ165DRAFT_1524090 [Panaeolus papilionaceus]|nr:hypothetical protein BJ165DRAFT_1524090 [Panaeolus papilionaceus]
MPELSRLQLLSPLPIFLSVGLLYTILAAATPTPRPRPLDVRAGIPRVFQGRQTIPSGSCGTRDFVCCEYISEPDVYPVPLLLALLGVVLTDPEDMYVGINCIEWEIVGPNLPGADCSPACCENTNFGGILAVDCVPPA